ncbi:MAG: restriction endonuclease subunit [Chryseobacterium sp.]|jgi:type I restriction enzyme S subunit|nr:restriction endonuclease subunit [Chryseobacterium sp.]
MMSDTEIKWKSTFKRKIPDGWEVKLFKDVVKIEGGNQPPLKYFVYKEKEGYIRLIQTRDYRTDKYKTYIPISLAKRLCTKEDIIIGRYGPPIFQIFKGLEGAYNVALMKAVPNEDIVNKNYCFYFISRPELRSFLEGLSQRSGGQTGVEIDKLNLYPFPLPPMCEQQKIAEILSTWDKAIQGTNNIIKALEKRNKMLAFSLLTGKKRLKEFVQTPLKKVMIKEIAKEISLKNKSDEDYTVFSCTKYNGLVPSLEYFGKKIYSDNLTTYKVVKKNQFAYATNHIEEGSIGILKNAQVGLISPMYTIFEFDNEINLNYAYSLLKTDFYINEYKRRMEGSIDRRGGLRWTEFSKIFINLPSLEEQNKIADVLNKANEELKQYKLKQENIKQQKKGLMQQLLTGKVRTI